MTSKYPRPSAAPAMRFAGGTGAFSELPRAQALTHHEQAYREDRKTRQADSARRRRHSGAGRRKSGDRPESAPNVRLRVRPRRLMASPYSRCPDRGTAPPRARRCFSTSTTRVRVRVSIGNACRARIAPGDAQASTIRMARALYPRWGLAGRCMLGPCIPAPRPGRATKHEARSNPATSSRQREPLDPR